MKPRVKKLPILLPVFVVVCLLAATAVKIYLERSNQISHTDLGEKYLNSMDYAGAAAEFMEGLTEDPTNSAARLGLAQAYFAMGETALVQDVLQPLTDNKDPESYRLLIQLENQNQDVNQALLTAQKLVVQTDAEADYVLLEELLQQVLAAPRSYAVGTDQTLLLSGGQVKAAGSNTLGQLGTEQLLASTQIQEQFISADFPGTASRVYCAGRTSYVVDAENNLWAAGENRWGQMGTGAAAMTAQAGWQKIVDSGDVASVAGTAGRLYLLKLDGSLWFAGQGGSMELHRVPGFYQVSMLEADDTSVAVLTLDGKLYKSSSSGSWEIVAKNVKQFSLCTGTLVWITVDGQLCSTKSIQAPQTWQWGKAGVTPDFDVIRVACDGNGILLQGADGVLRRLYGGGIFEYKDLKAAAIYAAGSCVVVETEAGPQCWDLSRAAPSVPQAG